MFLNSKLFSRARVNPSWLDVKLEGGNTTKEVPNVAPFQLNLYRDPCWEDGSSQLPKNLASCSHTGRTSSFENDKQLGFLPAALAVWTEKHQSKCSFHSPSLLTMSELGVFSARHLKPITVFPPHTPSLQWDHSRECLPPNLNGNLSSERNDLYSWQPKQKSSRGRELKEEIFCQLTSHSARVLWKTFSANSSGFYQTSYITKVVSWSFSGFI